MPAHIWTPHFSIFGAFSGFDTIEECFEDMTPYIHALETGLSSDPPMNWRISALDSYQLISNSDAHSPAKLGSCLLYTSIIAITNETESTLASKGELVLPLHVGEEEAVTTRTYMASICVSMLLASAIAEGNAFGMMQRIKRCLFLMEKTLSE